ncbi:hypothetical protein Q7P35_005280 [Cladosporium inversicolor]
MSLASAFLKHYIEYLSAPTVLVTLLLVVAPICYALYSDRSSTSASSSPRASKVPGCRRFGLAAGQSDLKDQFTPGPPTSSTKARVKALFVYPIKSCRGVQLPASEVQNTGLKYDRMFTFAQLHSKQAPANKATESSTDWEHEWRFVTARELPRLVMLETELWVPDLRTQSPRGHVRQVSDDTSKGDRGRSRSRKGTVTLESAGIDAERRRKLSIPFIAEDWRSNGGCLVITFPYEPDFNPFGLRTETVTIRIPLKPTPERAEAKLYTTEDIKVWKDYPQAINVSNEIDKVSMDKLKYFLGVSKPLALFRQDDRQLRHVTRNLPDPLADGRFRVGFADSYPLHVLNVASVRALDSNLPDEATLKGCLDARRFRANIYIEGPPAFDEDTWKRASFGRCIQPRLDLSRRGRSIHSSDNDDDDDSGPRKAESMFGCGTSRCTLPNVGPDTGVKDNSEPYKTLMRTRKTDENQPKAAFLGMQVIPLFELALISVGDEIEVLERS